MDTIKRDFRSQCDKHNNYFDRIIKEKNDE